MVDVRRENELNKENGEDGEVEELKYHGLFSETSILDEYVNM